MQREIDALTDAGWEVATESSGWLIAPPIGKFFARARMYLRTTSRIAKDIAADKPDLIVAHDIEMLRPAALVHRQTGVPVIYDSHEDWPGLIAENSRFESFVAKWVERYYLRTVSHVMTVSEPIAERFRQLGKPATVLYNARPRGEVQIIPRNEARTELELTNDDFVVGYIGALEQLMKGGIYVALFDAFRKLPERFKLVIVGGPNSGAMALHEALEQLWPELKERVWLTGYLPSSDTHRFYSALDLGLILLDARANYMQGLPNKLFDYMAHAVPVLAPDFPEMAKIIWQAQCGWLLGGWECAKIRRTMLLTTLLALGDRDDMSLQGWHGRHMYLQRYCWDRQAPTFVRVCESLTSR